MVFPRPTSSAASAAVFRSLARPTRGAAARAWRCQRTIARRGYAAEAGGEHEAKSWGDLPWLIGSVAVTVPAAYYMLQPSEDDPHGHIIHGHEAEKEEEHEEEIEQPTPSKVEAEVEKAAVAAADEKETETQSEEEKKAEEGQEEEAKPAEEGGEEQKSPKEAKAEAAPGQHEVVPDTAVQPPEAPSKK